MADQFSMMASEKGFSPAEIEILRTTSKLEGFSELEYKQRYQGPIIDVLDHTHRYGFETNERHENLPTGKELVEIRKTAGVKHTIMANRPNSYKAIKKRNAPEDPITFASHFESVSALCPADFIALAAKGYMELAKQDFNSNKNKLEKGLCLGFGEAGVIHYNKSLKVPAKGKSVRQQGEILSHLDNSYIIDMLKIANKYKKVVHIHIEPNFSPRGVNREDEVVKFYKNSCATYKNVKFVLSHNAMLPPKILGEIFNYCKNVFTQFKIMHGGWGMYWRFHDLNIINDFDLKLHKRWAHIIKSHSDRFMFGADFKIRRSKRISYEETIRRAREVIAGLDPDIQREIMFDNANRIYDLRINWQPH